MPLAEKMTSRCCKRPLLLLLGSCCYATTASFLLPTTVFSPLLQHRRDDPYQTNNSPPFLSSSKLFSSRQQRINGWYPDQILVNVDGERIMFDELYIEKSTDLVICKSKHQNVDFRIISFMMFVSSLIFFFLSTIIHSYVTHIKKTCPTWPKVVPVPIYVMKSRNIVFDESGISLVPIGLAGAVPVAN
jgi:hypothetical protein